MKRSQMYLTAIVSLLCFWLNTATVRPASDYVPYPVSVPAISVGDLHTVGLTSTGNAVATGYNGSGQCNVGEWSLEINEPTTTTTSPNGSSTTTSQTETCGITAIYGEYSVQTDRLRYFRDEVLSKTREGRKLIHLYYQWSPAIVKAMEENEEFKKDVKEMLGGVLRLITEKK